MSYWSTTEALKTVFFKNYGWLFLLGHGLFAIRTSTLWLSRGKDATPTAAEILSIAWYWLAGLSILLVFVCGIGLCRALAENWPRYKALISGDFGKYLGKVLPSTLAGPLLLGVLLAWAFGLDVFGGVLAATLTVAQIAAAVIPLAAKRLFE